MSEKTKKYLSDYKSALDNLNNVFQRNSSDDVVVDAGIKRFEISYKLAWKLIKNHLSDVGINCRNPRECFKEAKAHNLINKEVSWLKMIEDRNLLVHTYSLERSRTIFDKIKENYFSLLKNLSETLSDQLV